MRARISGSLVLLVLGLCADDSHAQQTARLQVGQAVRATLPADGALRYELDLPNGHFVAGRVDQDGVDATVTSRARSGSVCCGRRAWGGAARRRSRSRPTRRAGT
jgi:hypothetical protein